MTRKKAIRKSVPSLVQRPIHCAAPSLLHPAKRFAELQGEDGHHPVDVAVRSVPAVARRDRRLLRMSGVLARQLKDRRMFVDYEDLRFGQVLEKQEMYFDFGWAYGELAGRADSTAARLRTTPAAGALARKILATVTASGLSEKHATAVLLELARSIVLSSAKKSASRSRKARQQ